MCACKLFIELSIFGNHHHSNTLSYQAMWEHWELVTQLTGAGGVGGIFFVHWELITGKLITQLMRMGTMSTRYVRSFSNILLFVSLLFHDYKKCYKKWWYKTEILKFEVVPDQLKIWKPSQQDRKVVAFQHDTSEQGYSPDPSDSSSLGRKGLESRQCQRRDTIGCTLLPERGAVTSVFFAPPANHNTL